MSYRTTFGIVPPNFHLNSNITTNVAIHDLITLDGY
jgi:hypothetical protein